MANVPPIPAAADAAGAVVVYDNPCNDPDCYPIFDTFMKALQDPGEKNLKNNEMSYKPLMKALSRVQKTLALKYLKFGVPKNITDCKKQLVLACIRNRKSRDKGLVSENLRKYALPGSDSVFIINDDEEQGGFQIALDSCLQHWEGQKKRSFDSRSPGDACRLASILLLPNHRDAVSKIMSNKRDRLMQDQSSCPIKAFYEVVAQDFCNVAYNAKLPNKFTLIQGHETIDPNDIDRITLAGRDGAWMRSTWEDYLRPKYRKVLERWFSTTGGGSGLIENFQDYCKNERWLTYVFMIDAEMNFLLASNAQTLVPDELCNESGYYKKARNDSDGDVPADRKSGAGTSSMKAKINGALKSLEDNQATIANCLTLMTWMMRTHILR